MKIAIDARFYGVENGGLGRYTMNVITELSNLKSEHDFILLLSPKYAGHLSLPDNFKQVEVAARHYSLLEQITVPFILYKEQVDLVHFLHFNAPLLYRKRYLVTIHDLLMHQGVGMAATTRSPFVYAIKRLMYRVVFDNAVQTAKHIFVPTQVVKDELTHVYTGTAKKVSVIYEGIDTNLIKQNKKTFLTQNKIKAPYFLYVGNAYPHKNLSSLIEALIQVNTEAKATLVIVTPKNIFAKRLQKTIELLDAKQFVTVLTNVSDDSLSQLYSSAHAFVFPSLSEGFGLPGLESMAIGTPVLASDIPVFHEVYGKAAEYFNPNSIESLSGALKKSLIMSQSVRSKKTEAGIKHAATYSWHLMVKTLNVKYNAFK